MLKEVAGDILLTKAEALAHGVAPERQLCERVSSGTQRTVAGDV